MTQSKKRDANSHYKTRLRAITNMVYRRIIENVSTSKNTCLSFGDDFNLSFNSSKSLGSL